MAFENHPDYLKMIDEAMSALITELEEYIREAPAVLYTEYHEGLFESIREKSTKIKNLKLFLKETSEKKILQQRFEEFKKDLI